MHQSEEFWSILYESFTMIEEHIWIIDLKNAPEWRIFWIILSQSWTMVEEHFWIIDLKNALEWRVLYYFIWKLHLGWRKFLNCRPQESTRMKDFWTILCESFTMVEEHSWIDLKNERNDFDQFYLCNKNLTVVVEETQYNSVSNIDRIFVLHIGFLSILVGYFLRMLNAVTHFMVYYQFCVTLLLLWTLQVAL